MDEQTLSYIRTGGMIAGVLGSAVYCGHVVVEVIKSYRNRRINQIDEKTNNLENSVKKNISYSAKAM